VAALVITTDGRKLPVGLWLGDTENGTVVTALLADLQHRGLSTDGGLLVVNDGAKALATGVRRVFGAAASSSAARSTSGATSPATWARSWLAASIAAWRARSTTPIRPRGWRAPRPSPPNSTPITPTRRPACARAWPTCSPSAAWASRSAWPGP
jgi:hypothetical protein